MPRRETGREWLSAHLYFDGDIYVDKADRILVELVAPLVESLTARGWIDGWFFIRYYEEGSHLRLRFLASPDLLQDRVQPRILETVSAPPARALLERVEWRPYEPEIERYGGPEGVLRAEAWFQSSSAAAVALLRKVPPEDRPARLGKAMLAMLVMVHSFQPDRPLAAQLAHSYGQNYLRSLVPDPHQQERWFHAFESGFNRQADRLADYVEAAWEALDDGEELTPELDTYLADTRRTVRELQELATRGLLQHKGQQHKGQQHKGQQHKGQPTEDGSRALLHIVPSYIHMMNNRLGVSIQEECYLSVLIFLTLLGAPQESGEDSAREIHQPA